MRIFAVRTEIVRALLQDKIWCEKLNQAKNFAEAEKVLIEFCKEKGCELPPPYRMGSSCVTR
ncbi:MAG: hypothetical protein QXR76_03320 [Candidatus Bathyarchaeia archaeon]